MIIVQKRSPPREPTDVDLVLPFEQRQKSRLRTVLATGEEVGLFLERGAILRGGDCLESDDGRIVRVVAANETLMEVRAADAEMLARAAYHLGNRHTPVQIGETWLRRCRCRSSRRRAHMPQAIRTTPARQGTPA